MALSFWPLAIGWWLVLLHPVGTLGNVESEGRTPPPTSSCFRPRHPHVVLFSSSSSPPCPVGTHDLCVRCVKSYSIVVLTGMDAQIVRPLQSETSSRSFDNGRTDRASLQDSVTASVESECVPRPRHPHFVLFSSSSSPPHIVLLSSPSSPRRPVGTHDLCVRCVKGYSIVI